MNIEDNFDHFTRLPIEVVENIFTFIKREDLRECLLVNKIFNEIIIGSWKLMKHLTLFIDGSVRNNYKLKQIATIGRRYEKIKICNLYYQDIEIVDSGLRQIGKVATEVEILFCIVSDTKQLLSCFPNVTKLSLKKFYGSAAIISPTLFPKLKHLRLNSENSVSFVTFKITSYLNFLFTDSHSAGKVELGYN